MIGYFELFPEKCETELRTAQFLDETDVIPRGTYLFTEYYCQDLTCNCQRVLIKVLRADDPKVKPSEVATISFTWSEEHDETWEATVDEFDNPFLDPFHFQASYAESFLEFWHDMYRHDPAYADRIERHYAEVRNRPGVPRAPRIADVLFDTPSADDRRKRRRLLEQRNVKTKSRRKGS